MYAPTLTHSSVLEKELATASEARGAGGRISPRKSQPTGGRKARKTFAGEKAEEPNNENLATFVSKHLKLSQFCFWFVCRFLKGLGGESRTTRSQLQLTTFS
jgi:hypothetical protein